MTMAVIGSRPLFEGRSDPAGALAQWVRRLWNIEAFALFLYFARDAFAGAVRYYLNVIHLDAIWFIPDLVAIACIGVFFYRYVMIGRSLVATLFFAYTAFALVLGFIFLGSVAGMASAFKMFAPVFVGFCFCQRQMRDYPRLLGLITMLFYASVVGVVISSYINLPWVGYAYESFGATRQAGRLWWSAAEQRLAGFAADSTMAGYFVLMTFVFTSTRKGLAWSLGWGAVSFYAIKLTTSKTCLGLLVIYLLALIFVRIMREPQRFRVVRALAVYSFLAVLIPPLLMAIFSGIDLARMNPTLFSMQDRINNSWQLPFVYMSQLMPIGYVTGCGLGCFNYPQQLFSPELVRYFVPVDNFYLGTYLMFGMPFVIFMIFVLQSIRRSTDIYKLTIIFVMNIFTITVLSYGPASGLLLIGFAFSDVFATVGHGTFLSRVRTRLERRLPPRRAPPLPAYAVRPAE